MSHRKLKAFAERVSGKFVRLKPQAPELKYKAGSHRRHSR